MNTFALDTVRNHHNVIGYTVAAVIVFVLAQNNPGLFETGISVLTFSLIAIPLGLMYGHGGVISICQAAFAAVGGYASAKLTIDYGWSPWATMVIAMVVPGVLAFVLSRRILRLSELALALTTVAIGQAWAIFAGLAKPLTGGHIGIFGIPPLPFASDAAGAYIGGAIAVLVVIILYENFVHSARGRALNAIRTDPILASSTGGDVAAQRAVIFSIAAAVAGLGGWYYAHYVGFIAPDSLSFVQSTAILFMVVIGGRRSSIGPVVGAVVYIVASDLLPGGDIQGAYFGAMLVLVLLVLPDGAASLPKLVRRGIKRRSDSGPPTPVHASASPVPPSRVDDPTNTELPDA